MTTNELIYNYKLLKKRSLWRKVLKYNRDIDYVCTEPLSAGTDDGKNTECIVRLPWPVVRTEIEKIVQAYTEHFNRQGIDLQDDPIDLAFEEVPILTCGD
jgi:hypothetical protein